MPSITIHNLDESLYRLIKKESEKAGLSLNKTIKQLLKMHFGLAKRQENEFNEFLGVWSEKDTQEFINNTIELNTIDKNDWK